jgi:hypothetical protein
VRLYVSRSNSQTLIYSTGAVSFDSMPCDSCGHSKAAHKEMTLAVYFCNICQKVESHITFPPDRKVEDKNEGRSSADDMLSELYYNRKAFRR